MLAVLSRVPSVIAIWLVAGTILAWGWLPGRWRRLLALLTSVAGLALLVVAMNTEGLRESRTMAVFLIGTPYLTEQAAASASLPYYVLTGLCLLVGTTGLAVGDELARTLARRWMLVAITLSVTVTLVRFFLEKVAAPFQITQLFGVTWLSPVVGAYFLAMLHAEGKGWKALAGRLFVYGLVVRSFVAALYVTATRLHLGSHYDLSSVWVVSAPWRKVYHYQPGSLDQLFNLVLLPQILVWPVYTVLTGLLGAALFVVLSSARPNPQSPSMRAGVRMAGDAQSSPTSLI
jgi:hypothetical protein